MTTAYIVKKGIVWICNVSESNLVAVTRFWSVHFKRFFFSSFFEFIWFTFVRWYFVLVTPENSARQIWEHTKFHRKWFITMRLVARTIRLYLIRFLCAFVFIRVNIRRYFFFFFDFVRLLNRFVRLHRFSIICTTMASHRSCISNIVCSTCVPVLHI